MGSKNRRVKINDLPEGVRALLFCHGIRLWPSEWRHKTNLNLKLVPGDCPAFTRGNRVASNRCIASFQSASRERCRTAPAMRHARRVASGEWRAMRARKRLRRPVAAEVQRASRAPARMKPSFSEISRAARSEAVEIGVAVVQAVLARRHQAERGDAGAVGLADGRGEAVGEVFDHAVEGEVAVAGGAPDLGDEIGGRETGRHRA